MNKEALKRMSDTRTRLLIEHGFFGTIMMYLEFKESTDPNWVNTMATDGIYLYYWPEFVLNEIDLDEAIAIFIHEAFHLIYKHHIRMGYRDPDMWNIAGDYVINAEIKQFPRLKLPDWVYYDPKYLGWSTEDVYALQMIEKEKQQKQQQQQQEDHEGGGKSGAGNNSNEKGKDESQAQGASKPDSKDQGKPSSGGKGDEENAQSGNSKPSDVGRCGGVVLPANPEDKTAMEDLDRRWTRIIQQATDVALKQCAGSIPGYLERIIAEIKKPVVPWERELREFIDNSSSKEFSWNKPNRRFVHSGLILPSLRPNRLEHLVDVVDTSGSITDELEAKYNAECIALLDEGFCDKLTVICADSQVRNVQTFERGDEVNISFKGGGGTNFAPSFKYIEDNIYDASAILYFTDLITQDFGKDPHVPVLWVVYGTESSFKALAETVPFGKAIRAGL